MTISARTTPFQFGDWLVNPASNSVRRGELQRQMEPRAMDVLQVLCREPGAVLSAEQLLDACWGGVPHGDNPVHKTIAQLRRVLDDSSQAPRYIETIRKRGYRAIADMVPDTATAAGSWTGEAPFRGLDAFEERHNAIFCGRDDAVAALSAAIARQVRAGCAMVLVLGPSGAGKTSLVRAGLLGPMASASGAAGIANACPLVLDCAELEDGDLARALGSVLLDAEHGGRRLFDNDSAAALGLRLQTSPETVIGRLAQSGGIHTVVFIDRIEALFRMAQVDDDARDAFFAMLGRLARSGSVLVLLACRNDFYPSLAGQQELMGLKGGGGHVDLLPPTPAEIARMVRQPAHAAGLRFSPGTMGRPALDEILCEAARAGRDTLPLLQYCLHELYRQRSAEGELDHAVYARLGGIEGAIGARAEQVLNGLGSAEIGALPQVLSLLVEVGDDASAASARHAPWAALADARARALVQALVDARLFVSDLRDGVPAFGIAHEALLRRWPRMADWIERHRQALQLRGRIARQAARWEAGGRARDLLLPRGIQVNQATALLSDGAVLPGSLEREFIGASLRRVRRGERLRLAVSVLVAALALLASLQSLAARRAQHAAEQHRTEAEGLMGYMLGEFVDTLRPLGRLDVLDSVSTRALAYLEADAGDDPGPAALVQRARALQVVSEVKIARADPAGALRALLLAQDILERQLRAAPRDAALLKSAGANTFWLGQIAFDRSDWAGARRHFGAYRDLADRLAAAAPDSRDGPVEQSYAHNSLGSVALESGQVELAAQEFARSVDLKTRAMARAPGDSGLAADLANSLSWQATARARMGDLDGAMRLYRREAALLEPLHREGSGNTLWSTRYAYALWHQGELQAALGQGVQAREDFARAADLLRAATARDPSNREVQAALWTVELSSGPLDGDRLEGRDPGGAREGLDALSALEPDNLNLARLSALAQVNAARHALADRRAREAARILEPALARLAGLHAAAPRDRSIAQTYAEALLLEADALHTGAEPAAASAAAVADACLQARALLERDAPGSRDYRVLAPWVRAHLCLGENAAVSRQIEQLERMQYRQPAYLRYLSTHLPEGAIQ